MSRAAHRDDQVVSAPVGQALPVVQLNAVDDRPPLSQHLLVDARRLAGDVLEDEHAHAAIVARAAAARSVEAAEILVRLLPGRPGGDWNGLGR